MDLFQAPVLMLGMPVLLAYVCRLSMLSIWANRKAIIVMHASMAMSVGWAMYRAAEGHAVFGDIATVIGAGCWILISYSSWRDGVPEHYETQPKPLDTENWIRVHGGKKE